MADDPRTGLLIVSASLSTNAYPGSQMVDAGVAEIDRLRSALAAAEARAEKAERERDAAQGLDDEADVTPCAEDAAVVRGCARLVRANFSYDEADRLAALTPAHTEKED